MKINTFKRNNSVLVYLGRHQHVSHLIVTRYLGQFRRVHLTTPTVNSKPPTPCLGLKPRNPQSLGFSTVRLYQPSNRSVSIMHVLQVSVRVKTCFENGFAFFFGDSPPFWGYCDISYGGSCALSPHSGEKAVCHRDPCRLEGMNLYLFS